MEDYMFEVEDFEIEEEDIDVEEGYYAKDMTRALTRKNNFRKPIIKAKAKRKVDNYRTKAEFKYSDGNMRDLKRHHSMSMQEMEEMY